MKKLSLALIALLFTACSPKYEIKTNYNPPTDAQGRACIQECDVKRQTCQVHCNEKRDHCLAEAKERAKKAFPQIEAEYSAIMEEYASLMDRYEGEIASWDREHARLEQQFRTYRGLCDSKKDRKAYECRRAHEIDDDLEAMNAIEPSAPARPNRPILAEEIKEAQKSCSNKCGCQKSYDSCFVSCGGKLSHEKFCIENCK